MAQNVWPIVSAEDRARKAIIADRNRAQICLVAARQFASLALLNDAEDSRRAALCQSRPRAPAYGTLRSSFGRTRHATATSIITVRRITSGELLK